MMTTDTPRTDAILMECPSHLQEVALANLALDLELELAHSLANQVTVQAEIERLRNGFQGSCYCCEPVGILNQNLEAEVEFWKAKAYEAEASEGKHEAEVERLRSTLRSFN